MSEAVEQGDWGRAGGAEVRALLAASGLVAGQQLAALSQLAPDLSVRLSLATGAAERLVAPAGLTPTEASALPTFETLVREFEQRTRPTTWLEGLIRGCAVAGLSRDVTELVRPHVTASAAEALDGASPAGEAFLVPLIHESLGADPTQRDRASLYGRRLLAEMLALVQQVIARHLDLARFVTGASDDISVVSQWFPHLETGHARRMAEWGLIG